MPKSCLKVRGETAIASGKRVELARHIQMTVKAIIFDFDGTIADSQTAFTTIANRLSTAFNYPQVDAETIERFRNLSAREAIQASGLSLFQVFWLLRKARRELKQEIGNVPPIAGINAAIAQLRAYPFELGIVTSNLGENVRLFLAKNDLEDAFSCIHSGSTLFGKDRAIAKVMRHQQWSPQTTIYVGDETRDIEAARQSNVRALSVSWGFNSRDVLARHNPDVLVDTPQELVEFVLAANGTSSDRLSAVSLETRTEDPRSPDRTENKTQGPQNASKTPIL